MLLCVEKNVHDYARLRVMFTFIYLLNIPIIALYPIVISISFVHKYITDKKKTQNLKNKKIGLHIIIFFITKRKKTYICKGEGRNKEERA